MSNNNLYCLNLLYYLESHSRQLTCLDFKVIIFKFQIFLPLKSTMAAKQYHDKLLATAAVAEPVKVPRFIQTKAFALVVNQEVINPESKGQQC